MSGTGKAVAPELMPHIIAALPKGPRQGDVIMCCECCTHPGRVTEINTCDDVEVSRSDGTPLHVTLLVLCQNCMGNCEPPGGWFFVHLDAVVDVQRLAPRPGEVMH